MSKILPLRILTGDKFVNIRYFKIKVKINLPDFYPHHMHCSHMFHSILNLHKDLKIFLKKLFESGWSKLNSALELNNRTKIIMKI